MPENEPAPRPTPGKRQASAQSLRWSTRQLTTMALLMAVGLILSFVEFPLLPGTDFLKFDASSVAALLGGFSYGPGSGCVIGILVAWIHGLFNGNLAGALMNSVVVIAFVLPAAFAYRRNPSIATKIIGLFISSICMITVAILMNLLVTPTYMGAPLEAVIALISPVLLPFNILKALINAVLAFILERSLRSFLAR